MSWPSWRGYAFALIQKSWYVLGVNDADFHSLYGVMLAYLGAAVLAFVWRFLMSRLYTLLQAALISPSSSSGEAAHTTEKGVIEEQLRDVQREHQQLKDDVALRLIGLRQMAAAQSVPAHSE